MGAVIYGRCPVCGFRIGDDGWPTEHKNDEGVACPYEWYEDPHQFTPVELYLRDVGQVERAFYEIVDGPPVTYEEMMAAIREKYGYDVPG